MVHRALNDDVIHMNRLNSSKQPGGYLTTFNTLNKSTVAGVCCCYVHHGPSFHLNIVQW